MIRVSGMAKLTVSFSVDLDMTEQEFDALSERQVERLLEDRIDWHDACRAADVDRIDVDELEELRK